MLSRPDHIFGRKLSTIWLILPLSLFLTLSGNHTFFNKVEEVYPLAQNLLFQGSLFLTLFMFTALISGIFMLFLPRKLVAILLVLITAASGYFTDSFGVPIDTEMLRNAVETNVNEAKDLMNANFAIHLLLFGLLPCLIILLAPLKKYSLARRELSLAKAISVTLFGLVISIFPFTDGYASFLREHKPLRFFTNPVYPIYSAGYLASKSFQSAQNQEYTQRVDTAQINPNDEADELIILVIGETARADHFAINGYNRDTTPLLNQQEHVVSFKNATSCGTSTAISVPCIFSLDSRENFKLDSASNTENILDVLAKAEVSVLWRDNNSSSKGVADRIPYQDFSNPDLNPLCDEVECRDEGMLSGLNEYIDQQPGDILIVLHQMGSHGPAYYKRYPDDFAKFQPACDNADLAKCQQEEIVNSYDNTILYTDFFLNKVIELLKTKSGKYETTMIYASDHGESLGELGVYLHGMPYMIAPEAQTHVPIIVWAGPTSDLDYDFLTSVSKENVSHDDISHWLMDAFEVAAQPQPIRHPEALAMDFDE